MTRTIVGGMLGGAGLAVATVGEASPDMWTNRLYAVASVLVQLVALVVALTALPKAYQSLRDKLASKGGDDDSTPRPPTPPSPPTPGSGTLAAVVALMLSLSASFVGCSAIAKSPATRYYAATTAYTTALNAASALRQSGTIDDRTYWQVEAARTIAAAGLDVLRRQAVAGVPLDEPTLAATEGAVTRLAAALQTANESGSGNHRGAGPGTRPAFQGGGDDRPVQQDGGGADAGRTRGAGGVAFSGGDAVGVAPPEVNARYFGDNARWTLPRGDAGTYETLWAMRACVDHAVESGGPTARLGVRLAVDSHKGDAARVRKIYDFCRESVTFKRDPVALENLRHPDQLAEEIAEYGGTAADCDDVAMFAAALLRTVGIRPGLMVVSVQPNQVYHHVTAAAFVGGRWQVVDPQERMLGALPAAATRAALLAW